MKFQKSILSILAICGFVLAETPDGFPLSVPTRLDVNYGSLSITPGISTTKSATSKQPTLAYANATATDTYVFVMIDMDVSGSFTGSSGRTTLVHALLSGIKSTAPPALTITSTGPASYIGPQPPAENPAHAHKYVELLFKQSQAFNVPANQYGGMQQRLGFNITKFIADQKLEAPLAANWLQVPSGST